MDPYMRTLYDALYDIAGASAAKEKIAKKVVEIAPVAYMRGRTFHDTFLILDEAQNCTYDQLKMVITRLGENSKLVVSGDTTQSDLNGKSGLATIVERLADTYDIAVCKFKAQDVVRSDIVRAVLAALEKYEKE
jgi:phosphate starvation-inducible protein PhoH and related proteins